MDRLCYLYEQVSVPADKKFKDRSVCVLCVYACMCVLCVCVCMCVPLRAREPVHRLYLGVNWDLEGCALRGFWLCPFLSLSLFIPIPAFLLFFHLFNHLYKMLVMSLPPSAMVLHLCLHSQGFPTANIVQLFDAVKSPRCYAIIATKY